MTIQPEWQYQNVNKYFTKVKPVEIFEDVGLTEQKCGRWYGCAGGRNVR